MKHRFLISVLAIAGLVLAGATVLLTGNAGDSQQAELQLAARTELATACGSLSKDRSALKDCVGEYVKSAVETKGFKATAADLEASVDRVPEINIVCHSFAHYIGRGAWEELHSVRKALTSATNFCAWGYLHGLNVAASNDLKGQELLDTLLDGCSYLEELKGNKYECAHGIGDAMVDSSGNDDLLYAFEWCGRIADKSMHMSCSEGAANYWVDYRMVDELIVHKGTPTALESRLLNGEPYALCLEVQDPLDRGGCLDYASHLRQGYPNGLADIETACRALRGSDNSGCFRGLGREYAFEKDVTVAEGVARCQLAKEPRGVAGCMYYFVSARTQVYRDVSGKIYNEACSLRSAKNDARVKDACELLYDGLGEYFAGNTTI